MKEITDKLAHELLAWIKGIEIAAGHYEKKCHPTKEFMHSTNYGTLGQLAFMCRAHLCHHMRDMIEHPDFKREESE